MTFGSSPSWTVNHPPGPACRVCQPSDPWPVITHVQQAGPWLVAAGLPLAWIPHPLRDFWLVLPASPVPSSLYMEKPVERLVGAGERVLALGQCFAWWPGFS